MLVKNLNSGYVVRRIGRFRDVITLSIKPHFCISCKRVIAKGEKYIRTERKFKSPFQECLDCYPIKEITWN